MNKVLFIENDAVVAGIYRNKLSMEGFQVEVVSDGETGLQRARETAPDVILLDLMLPKLTGLEVIRILRADPAFQTTPIIVLTGTYLTSMVQEAWKAGATKCLAKANTTPKILVDTLRSMLQPTPRAEVRPQPDRPLAAEPVRSGLLAPDEDFQAELRRDFLQQLPQTLGVFRQHLQAINRAASASERLHQLQELQHRMRAFAGSAGLVGLSGLSRVADLFEALLRELVGKPEAWTVSTLRTVAAAVDCLHWLAQRCHLPEVQNLPQATALVVEDEPLARRAVTHALEKARIRTVAVENAETALNLAAENRFDLVILDVDLPGMNGFALCTQLRRSPAFGHTPVLFVTSLNDLQARSSSTMSGGNDFIAKPFLFTELALKALMFTLRYQVEQAVAPPPACPASDTDSSAQSHAES
ncbi:MAG: response regulator [Verrucomicrobiota bacterium]|nr:response regulator [Limisphaera sp.]MDW8383060.1 response regulator [Verrucomicrobiota bacterium]